MSVTTISHYRILDRLGAGGMGEVYRAEDLRLHRFVALKTLRDADGLGDDAVSRVLAEARAASALNHPNIAVIYDAGALDQDGRTIGFIAMELVEGHTLATLVRDGPLPIDRVLDIVEPIADALGEAHDKGLVHRDIKPSNVMVTPAGRVKLLDFGVAQRCPRPAIGPDDSTRTGDIAQTAGFVGTLPYVAPEQATQREVDGRADIFSLGVLLYELIRGTPPFTGDNPAQLLAAILRDDEMPPFPSSPDPRLPRLERLIRLMLARDPDRRIASVRDVHSALVAIRTGEGLPATVDRGDEPSRLAIAGFRNISGNAEDDWLGTGIAETLTADLAQLEGVSVIRRERVSESIRLLGPSKAGDQDDALILRAARELRARWVVVGGFQRSGEAVRVTASLMDVASGQLARTVRVDGGLRAIFDLQDQIVRELAQALRAQALQAAGSPQTHASGDTAVVEAYEALSRGMLNRAAETHEALDRAGWLFERAVALDPTYARAHLELGSVHATRADYLGLPELRERALLSLRRAIELQPESARAWRELGSVLVTMRQHTEGIAAIRRALALDPDDASTLGAMGRALFTGLARFREAADWYERALDRNGKGGWYALQLAHCAALLRDFPRGERAAQRAVALQEAFLSGREGLFIAGAYMRSGHLASLQGNYARAIAAFEQEVDFLMRTDHALRARILVELNTRLGAAYRGLGDMRKAQAAFDVALDGFERRVRLGADDPFTRYYAASVHALRGDAETALAFLQRALSQQPTFTAARARIEPEFESLRADPRFQRLVGL